MFKGISDLMGLMKQAGQMQSKLAEVQENLKKLRLQGSSGGGMVQIEVSGQLQILSCKIDPSLLGDGDPEILEDLLVSAVNNALEKARRATAEEMQKLSGGVDLSSMSGLLQKMGLNPGAPPASGSTDDHE